MHPFDAAIPHITDWVKRKGTVSISRKQHAFIEVYTKDSHLAWADFGKYADIDAALHALNEFLGSWSNPNDKIEPTRIDAIAFLQNPLSLPFSIGDTHGEIQAVLGPPEEIYAPISSSPSSTSDFNIWTYGELYIYFKQGRVVTFYLSSYSLQNDEFYPEYSNFQFQGIESFDDDEEDWPEFFESLDLKFEIDDLTDRPSFLFESGAWLVDFTQNSNTNGCSNYHIGFGESSLPEFEKTHNPTRELTQLKASFLAETKFKSYFPVCCSCLEDGMTLSLHGSSKKIILTDKNGADFNDAKFYPFSIGTKLNAMEASSKRYIPKREALYSTKVTLSSFFKTGKFGPIELGMTKAQILEIFGPPEVNANIPSGCSMMEGVIWLYNSMEFYFYENEKPENSELHQISRSSLFYHYKEWAEEVEKYEGLQIIPDITENSNPPSLREVLAFAKAKNLKVSFQHYYEGQFKAIFDSGAFFMFFLEDETDVSFEDALEKAIDLPADYLGNYASDRIPSRKKLRIPFVL